jgi:predicted TPR repeat methyltransferase
MANYDNWAFFYNNSFNIGYADFIFSLIHERLEKFDICKGRLIDLGCGTGLVTSKFLDLGWDCIGLDISSEMIKIADKIKNDVFFEYNITKHKEKLDNLFDLAISTYDIINHLANDLLYHKLK